MRKPEIDKLFNVTVETDSSDHMTYYYIEWKKTPLGYPKRAGYLVVAKNHMVIDIEVKVKMRGKGIGRYLYSYAIKHRGKLITDYAQATESAQAVHRILTKRFKCKFNFFKGTITYSSN